VPLEPDAPPLAAALPPLLDVPPLLDAPPEFEAPPLDAAASLAPLGFESEEHPVATKRSATETRESAPSITSPYIRVATGRTTICDSPWRE
jgi:hypothetical protein